MNFEEIKEAIVGKTLYYWETDKGFSTDELCEVIRDIKPNGEYNPHIVFDGMTLTFSHFAR